MNDTKHRSLIKTITWRSIAIINSYIVLVLILTEDPLYNSLIMNGTGMVMYYMHERVWNKEK